LKLLLLNFYACLGLEEPGHGVGDVKQGLAIDAQQQGYSKGFKIADFDAKKN
jgi:hypothetical protein